MTVGQLKLIRAARNNKCTAREVMITHMENLGCNMDDYNKEEQDEMLTKIRIKVYYITFITF